MVNFADFAIAFGIVFVAEFADKTQLALLAMSARGKGLRVWIGAAAAFLILTVLAAVAGNSIQRFVPRWVIAVLAAALFISFGLLALLRRNEESEVAVLRTGLMPAFTLMLMAELGDKTQLSVVALAAESGAFWPTVVGGTLALWVSAALAVLAGGWIGRRVRRELVERVGGVMFLVIGLVILAVEFVF